LYNIFYILERNYEVQQHQKRAPAASNSPSNAKVDPYIATRPEKYRDLVLPYNWYIFGMNKVKRSKYKNHGVISFKELNKLVSERWENVSDETRQFCKQIADDERDRYKREVNEYVARYGREAFDAQKTTYTKRQKTSGTKHQTTRNEDGDHVSDESEDESSFHCESESPSQQPHGMMARPTPAGLDTTVSYNS
jgi:hypothetical protein